MNFLDFYYNARIFASDFLVGAAAPFRAVPVLARTPPTWKWALAPGALVLGAYTLAAWLFLGKLVPFVVQNFPMPESHAAAVALKTLIALTMAAALLALFALTFTLCVLLLAPPFMDMLSRSLERHHFRLEPEGGPGSLAREIVLSLKNNAALALRLVFWAALLFPLNFVIPVLGALPGILAACYFLGLSFLVYSAEHRGLTLGRLEASLKGRRGLALGLGATAWASTLVPLLPVAAVACAAAGGTMIYNEQIKDADGA